MSNANYTCIFLTVKRPVSTTKVEKRSTTSSHYKRTSEYFVIVILGICDLQSLNILPVILGCVQILANV